MPIPIASVEEFPNWQENFGISDFQRNKLLEGVIPQYILDFKGFFLQGTPFVGQIHSYIIVYFEKCN